MQRTGETMKKVEFELLDQDGNLFSTKEMLGKRWILFFYPAALTPGCVIEAGSFRDEYQQFSKAGYEIVGISPDPPKANAKFREVENLPFRLLSDEEHEIASRLGAWGVKSSFGRQYEGLIRSTFVIDEKGEIEREYRNVRAKEHVGVLEGDLGL